MDMPRYQKRDGLPVAHIVSPPGTAPGTLIVDPDAPQPRLSLIGFGPDECEEVTVDSLTSIAEYRDRWPVLWLNVDGLGNRELLQAIAAEFGLHRLALEDVVNVPQRPKCDVFDDHLFIVSRMLIRDEAPATEQVSLFVAKNFILTFQERVGDVFEPVRDRIRHGRGRIRSSGPDYLMYALLDAMIDGYYPFVEDCGDRLDALEEDVFVASDGTLGERIHGIQRELLLVRKALTPLREVPRDLHREEFDLLDSGTKIYLRDCSDHVIQLAEQIETYRELASGLMDAHLANVSHRMNEIMKVLTIFAAVFIPLGFIAGLYGMNFDSASPWNLPELRWKYGYPAVLGLMLLTAAGLLYSFRRRGWIGSSQRSERQER